MEIARAAAMRAVAENVNNNKKLVIEMKEITK